VTCAGFFVKVCVSAWFCGRSIVVGQNKHVPGTFVFISSFPILLFVLFTNREPTSNRLRILHPSLQVFSLAALFANTIFAVKVKAYLFLLAAVADLGLKKVDLIQRISLPKPCVEG